MTSPDLAPLHDADRRLLDTIQRLLSIRAAATATPEHFTEADLRFLAAVSDWIGMMTHRAEEYEEPHPNRRLGRRARPLPPGAR